MCQARADCEVPICKDMWRCLNLHHELLEVLRMERTVLHAVTLVYIHLLVTLRVARKDIRAVIACDCGRAHDCQALMRAPASGAVVVVSMDSGNRVNHARTHKATTTTTRSTLCG